MESNAWCPRLTAAMILSGSAVHVKGFGSALVSARKRLMAARRSTTERKTPRFKRRLDSLAKKPSTALSQEHEVGVKWKTKRSCRSSQARTLGCLWAQHAAPPPSGVHALPERDRGRGAGRQDGPRHPRQLRRSKCRRSLRFTARAQILWASMF